MRGLNQQVANLSIFARRSARSNRARSANSLGTRVLITLYSGPEDEKVGNSCQDLTIWCKWRWQCDNSPWLREAGGSCHTLLGL